MLYVIISYRRFPLPLITFYCRLQIIGSRNKPPPHSISRCAAIHLQLCVVLLHCSAIEYHTDRTVLTAEEVGLSLGSILSASSFKSRETAAAAAPSSPAYTSPLALSLPMSSQRVQQGWVVTMEFILISSFRKMLTPAIF